MYFGHEGLTYPEHVIPLVEELSDVEKTTP